MIVAINKCDLEGVDPEDILQQLASIDPPVVSGAPDSSLSRCCSAGPSVAGRRKITITSTNSLCVVSGWIDGSMAVEQFGGEVMTVSVSAKTGLGLAELEDAILLQAELMGERTHSSRLLRTTVCALNGSFAGTRH